MLWEYRPNMNTQLKNEDVLGLGAVLVGSLPATLLTDEAPERYTVEAVFTRKADPDEVSAIEGLDMRDHLAQNGFPTVELHVSDRRLEIINTNLEELRDGLAAVLADRLAETSRALVAVREITALRHEEASIREEERAASVAALAGSVVFQHRAERPEDNSVTS